MLMKPPDSDQGAFSFYSDGFETHRYCLLSSAIES